MGVKLSMASQLKFFYDVLGKDFTDSQVKPLLDAGGTLNVEFTKLTATVQGTKHELDLPASTTLLMKHQASPALAEMAVKSITEWVYTLNKIQSQGVAHGGIGVFAPMGGGGAGGFSGAVPPFPSGGIVAGSGGSAGGNGGTATITGTVHVSPPEPDYLAELAKVTGLPDTVVADLKTKLGHSSPSPSTLDLLKKAATAPQPFEPAPEPYEAPQPIKKKATKSAPSKVGGKVVLLRDATEIGQRVRGTDASSVYTVVALAAHVKLAVRVLGGKISIRAEFTDGNHADEQNKLASMGLNLNNGGGAPYMSAHMQADNVTAGRVVGAFLFDCGIDFDQQMSNMKGLNHADHQ